MHTKYTLIMVPIIFVLSLIISILVYMVFKNKSDKARRIPFLIISSLFVVLEISKQVYEFNSEYNLFSIPLHICSLFVYVPVFAAFLDQDKKFTKIMWAFTVSISVMVTIALVVGANPICGNGMKAILLNEADYLNYNSVIFHGLVVLLTFLCVVLKPWKPNLKEAMYADCIYGGYLIVAWTVANSIDVDLSSFIRYGRKFYIQFGLFVIYLIGFMISACIVFYGCKWYQKRNELKNR